MFSVELYLPSAETDVGVILNTVAAQRERALPSPIVTFVNKTVYFTTLPTQNL